MQNEYSCTVHSLIKEFINYLERKGTSIITIKQYYNSIYAILGEDNFTIDEKVVHANKEIYLIEKKLIKWIENHTQKLKPLTFNHYVNKLDYFADYLSNNDYIEKSLNLTKKYCKKITPSEPKQYSEDELSSIIHKTIFKDKELALLLLFLYYTGARITEAVTLTWSQIDFEMKTITVSNKIKKHQKEEIPISIKVEKILYLMKQLNDVNYKRRPKFNKNKVFRWGSREATLPHLKEILKELNINENYKSFHRFRKNYTQMLLDQQLKMGISDDVIKLLIRHRNIDLTRSVYGKTKTKLLAETMNRMYV